ncbi:MAG: universal stress protein [Saprospiraceae bacterium]|nr:MAG: universal stress protein [Saprospiraceae bacterium]
MKKRTKILVPVDFSACSENALAFAMQLADKIKANLQILHVPLFYSGIGDNPVSLSMSIHEQVRQSRIQMKNFIEKVTDNVRLSLDKIPTIQTSIELGKVEFTILKEAVSNEVDYIIMGTQGERSTLDRYLGTMASNIVKNAPCSVIVIPENTEFRKKIELGYATDFSEIDPSEIWKVVKLFKPSQPAIKCVHFNEKQVNNADKIKEFKSYLAENAPELNIEFYDLPVNNTVEYMNYFIENQNISMLVMYKPERTFFESIFHKSYTQKMARHVNIPLLVLKQKNNN